LVATLGVLTRRTSISPASAVISQPRAAALPRSRTSHAAAIDPKNPSTWGKVQRNAPCPCGSGKKFKHCHGRLD